MGDNYYLAGECKVNDFSKKKEMNDLIIKILDKTGIRNTATIMLNGEKVTVVEKALPDINGIVQFNYSIFENIVRDGNYYDCNNCKLIITDGGVNEFGLSMNLVRTIMEAYSDTPCYLMAKDELCGIDGLAEIIECLTGKILNFTHRNNIFDTMVFFNSNDIYKNVTPIDLISKWPVEYGKFEHKQLMCAIWTEKGINKPVKTEKQSDIHRMEKILLSVIDEMKAKPEEKERYLDFIIKLLDLTLDERKKKAKPKEDFYFLTEASVKVPGAALMIAYSQAFSINFYDLWKKVGKTGYWDIECEDKMDKEETDHLPIDKHFFQKCIMRDNEDEFMEFYDGGELDLSPERKSDIAEWKRRYADISDSDVDALSIEETLADLVKILHTVWNCKYVAKDMVDDFMQHKDDINYKKALYLLNKLLQNKIDLFGEFTRNQALEVLKTVNQKENADYFSGYFDLIGNKRYRNEVLVGRFR